MLPLSNLNSTITFPVRIHDQSCGIRSGRAAWCGEPQNIHLTFKFGGFFTTDFWWYWGYHWVYSTTLINIFTSAELPIQRNPACSSSANSFFFHQRQFTRNHRKWNVQFSSAIVEIWNRRPTPKVTHLGTTTQYPLMFEHRKMINAMKLESLVCHKSDSCGVSLVWYSF